MYSNVYVKFNKWIFEKYFLNHLNSYANVATLLTNIAQIQDFPDFSRICQYIAGENWELFCWIPPTSVWAKEKLEAGHCRVPLCLGVIAVQLLAASARHDDELYTANAYNPRLCNLLAISQNSLQQKYASAQENLYRIFQKWCEENNLLFVIPEISGNYHRHVRYPLSLALLHRQELDALHNFFGRSVFQAHEELFFDEFHKRFFSGTDYLLNEVVPSVVRKLRKAEEWRKQAILRQIYTEYLEWDGTYSLAVEMVPSVSVKKRTSEVHEYSIYWVEKANMPPEFYCDEEPAGMREGFYLQSPCDRYRWEFLPTLQLSVNLTRPCILLSKRDGSPYSVLIGNENPSLIFENCRINKLTPEMIAMLIQSFPKHFLGCAALHLTGGIRLGIRNWMEGAGPLVEKDNFSGDTAWLFCEGKAPEKILLSAQEIQYYPPGKYILRYHPDAPPIHFSISAPEEIQENSHSGWYFEENRKQFLPGNGEKVHCHGLDFGSIPVQLFAVESSDIGNPVRKWMMLAAGQEVSSPAEELVLHQILRRDRYGIRNR